MQIKSEAGLAAIFFFTLGLAIALTWWQAPAGDFASDIFNLGLILLFLFLPPALGGLLIMRFITPRHLVERYFKEPHFTRGELVMFRHFPGSIVRTLLFMYACWVSKKRCERRQLTDFAEVAPRWYVITSTVFTFWLLIHGFVAIFLLFGLGVGASFTIRDLESF